MSQFSNLSLSELLSLRNRFLDEYREYQSQNLHLDMSRGKPSAEQLDLSNGILSALNENDYKTEDGIDCRNYGGLDGLPEMKKLFSDLLDVSPEEVIVGGNSSLTMMFDNIASNMTHGVRDGWPWMQQGEVKFICPVPGYDRHFAICDYFHIKMISVPLLEDGPDMDMVEKLVSDDPMIKGMWCVPIYSNPDGITYSDEVVHRLANLKPAAGDFRLYWDNAYVIHSFTGENNKIPNILKECEKAGNPNMPLMFASFSKVSFSGAAVAMMASSKSNCDYIRKRLAIQQIGPDKLNQLRHIRFFKNADGVREHMKKHAAIIKPKMDLVLRELDSHLDGTGIARWSKPTGGYFISFYAYPGCAKRIVEKCREAGVILTNAGAAYPHGIDPDDSHIRIAPTYPSPKDLYSAIQVFCCTVKLVCIEKIIEEKGGKLDEEQI